MRPLPRTLARAGLIVLILNEVRGLITVALTAPVWWPMVSAMFHAALHGGR